MKKDLKWLAENVEWPEGCAELIGLDPDGEIRFGPGDAAEYDYYPEEPAIGITRIEFRLGENYGYTRKEFLKAKAELSK